MDRYVTHATFSLERDYPVSPGPGLRGLGRSRREGQMVRAQPGCPARA